MTTLEHNLGLPRLKPKERGPLVLSNVSVVTMTDPTPRPGWSLRIEDGTITECGPDLSVRRDGARVVDGRGGHVIPGLADMHTHWYDPGAASLYLAHGVTTVRNMWGEPEHLAYGAVVEAGEWPGPRMVTASPIVDGPAPWGGPYIPGIQLIDDPGAAEELVAGYHDRGYAQLKVYSWLNEPTLRALCAAASDRGMRVTGHCPEVLSYETAIDAGVTCFEHFVNIARGHLSEAGNRAFEQLQSPMGRFIDPEGLRLLTQELDVDAIAELAAEMAAKDVWNCPTVVAAQNVYRSTSRGVPPAVLRYERPETVRRWDPEGGVRPAEVSGLLRAVAPHLDALDQVNKQLIAILHRAGARLLIGTDSPNPFVPHGRTVHDELENFVAAGLSPFDALRCATVEAAAFLDDPVGGTVEAGKRADLVLLEGNPLSDVSATRSVAGVLVNGWFLDHDDLADLLAFRSEQVSGNLPLPGPLDTAVLPVATGRRLEEGRLAESRAGCDTGAVLTYEVRRGVDDDVVLDERWESDTQRTRVRARLTADGRVLHVRKESELAVGKASWEISRTRDGYAVRQSGYDGRAFSRQIEHEGLLVAAPSLSLVAPALLDGAGDFTVGALELPGDEVRVCEVRVEPQDTAAVIGVVGAPLGPATYTWVNGQLHTIEEQLLLTPRRFSRRAAD